MKKIITIIILLTILPVNAGNIYSPKMLIDYASVEVYLSKDLANIQDIKKLEIFAKQINKLPDSIPRIKFIQSDEMLEKGFNNFIAKSKALSLESKEKNVMQIFIAYKPGESYGLGNVIGKVFATNSGLIILNDIRINQAYEYHKGFTTNLIVHEILHIYGLAHAVGLSQYVTNIAAMSLGKSSPIGMSYDDIAGLLENYNVQSKLANFPITSNAKEVILLNGSKTQAKNVKNNQVTFTHVLKGRYWLIEDGIKIKKIRIYAD